MTLEPPNERRSASYEQRLKESGLVVAKTPTTAIVYRFHENGLALLWSHAVEAALPKMGTGFDYTKGTPWISTPAWNFLGKKGEAAICHACGWEYGHRSNIGARGDGNRHDTKIRGDHVPQEWRGKTVAIKTKASPRDPLTFRRSGIGAFNADVGFLAAWWGDHSVLLVGWITRKDFLARALEHPIDDQVIGVPQTDLEEPDMFLLDLVPFAGEMRTWPVIVDFDLSPFRACNVPARVETADEEISRMERFLEDGRRPFPDPMNWRLDDTAWRGKMVAYLDGRNRR